MTGAPVGVGVIGAGVISKQYLENLTEFPDLAVRFIADLDVERARAQADAFGVAESGTVAELLARDDIEIVVNLTIPAAHVEVGLQILAAGKHVWSEKPIALDRQSGRRLLDEAARVGLRVACAPDTVLGAGIQTGLRRIAAGDIGTPLTALAIMHGPGPESWHPNPEFLFDVGGGPLFDMGPYYLTTLVHVFGPVRRVSATSSTSRATRVIGSGPRAGTEFPVNVPTAHSALIEFESGASAVALFSFESHLARAGVVEVTGVTGTLGFPDPNHFVGDSRLWRNGGEPTEVEAVGSTFGRGSGVLDLARAIRSGTPERAPGELAFHVLDIMASIAEAATTGSPVELASTAPKPEPLPEDWDPSSPTF
ncbi:Gfo/Idh/MocA family protein [Lysobacter korlensis]|uniref:Gfo/Idh/MocA family protein n=1 Tax=Lysobacter korlensis TaxID=553636 RepID=A0ABV6S1A7_9GAMM